MRTAILASLVVGLGACAYVGRELPPLPPLAEDARQPALALVEHVLSEHMPPFGPGISPTTCVRVGPTPLTDEQEQALIARFVRLAPAARCAPQGAGVVDAITGEPAQLLEVRDFACSDPTSCTANVRVPGDAAETHYEMYFVDGAWRHQAHMKIIVT